MPAILLDRGVLAVGGAEARGFLNGLVTCDMAKVAPGAPAFGALLSPQGKVLFDFFLVQDDERFLIDVAAERAAELAKRLGFYKLRAAVTIEPLPTKRVVALLAPEPPTPARAILFDDPRSGPRRAGADGDDARLGARAIVDARDAAFARDASDLYTHARIAATAPEGGLDFVYGDVFPHDVNMDLLHGVAFDKGCYVGQEVVSRTHHRGLIRRRTRRVSVDGAPPPPGAPILAGDLVVGALGSTRDGRGLAVLRIDRTAEARAAGADLRAGDALVREDA